MEATGISQSGDTTCAIVFDIDGVLVKGHHPIPGAKEALQKLENDHPEFDIQFSCSYHITAFHLFL
jgi:ribonucleotide monophosphatase NagD (HAD superfamily)